MKKLIQLQSAFPRHGNVANASGNPAHRLRICIHAMEGGGEGEGRKEIPINLNAD